MSKDLKLEKICDHKIVEEQVLISDDLKTIYISRVLASKEITLYANDYLIPKEDAKNGWKIEEDTRSIYLKKSKIIFNKTRKSKSDYYSISYFVQQPYCPKCLGLNVVNDISYTKLGKVVMVENEEKLLQEVLKGLATDLGSNQFHDWIGTQIYSLIGSKIFNAEIIKSRIVQEITNYLDKYTEIQNQQSRFQDVTDREAFYKILSIDIQPLYDVDISYWTVSIIFQSKTGADMLYEKKFEIPGSNLLYK